MKPIAGGKRLLGTPKRFTTAVIILLVLVGLADAVFVAVSTNASNHELLQGRAQAVANALPTQDILQLEGGSSDQDRPAYVRLKESLKTIQINNSDVAYVYLLDRRENTALFLADSYQRNSPEYNEPGTIYPGASQQLLNSFTSLKSFTEGPVRDEQGWWVTGVAPIIDPTTREVIAVIDIGIPATTFYQQPLLYSLVPIFLTAIPLVGLLRDRKLAAKERELGHLKNQLVSIASHELRSPMSGMLWAIQRLLKPENTNLTIEQEELLTDIYRSGASSMATINEILDFSIFERSQTGKLHREQIELHTVLKDVAQTLRLGAQEKQLTILLDPSWPRKAYTKGDLGALKRAFMNIISNAIKYSYPDTTIEITYSLSNNMHVIGIKDHGIGVPKNEITKVLDGYYRAKNAIKVQSTGTGLGLWITRLVVEQHGGRVGLESEEDKGTTIFVALPALSTEALETKA